jgi:agmatine deiminase
MVTTGHVDEFCRFVGPRTVLLAEVHGTQNGVIERINRSRLRKAEKVLRESADENGKPLEIVRIPAAPVQYMEMDTKDPQFTQMQAIRGSQLKHKKSAPVLIAASYVNFLLTNNVVVMPKYFWPGESPESWEHVDREAKEVMERVFPGRTVVQIDNLHINAGGGGFNCSSCNEPLLCDLK